MPSGHAVQPAVTVHHGSLSPLLWPGRLHTVFCSKHSHIQHEHRTGKVSWPVDEVGTVVMGVAAC